MLLQTCKCTLICFRFRMYFQRIVCQCCCFRRKGRNSIELRPTKQNSHSDLARSRSEKYRGKHIPSHFYQSKYSAEMIMYCRNWIIKLVSFWLYWVKEDKYKHQFKLLGSSVSKNWFQGGASYKIILDVLAVMQITKRSVILGTSSVPNLWPSESPTLFPFFHSVSFNISMDLYLNN
jgi:hypothetical protein